jgi:hypothetical protein
MIARHPVPSPEEMARQLEALAASSGNSAFRRAASALLRPARGRPPLDDLDLVVEVDHLIRHGGARSVRAAAMRVASAYCPDQAEAVADPLRRKYRAGKYFGTKVFNPKKR